MLLTWWQILLVMAVSVALTCLTGLIGEALSTLSRNTKDQDHEND